MLPLIKAKPSIAATLASVSISQVLYHSLFSYFPTDLSGAGSYDPHAHHKPIVVNLEGIETAESLGLGMLAAHIIAGIITLLLLHSSERAVSKLLQLWQALGMIIAEWVSAPVHTALPKVGMRAAQVAGPDVAPLSRITSGVQPTRGPPVLV